MLTQISNCSNALTWLYKLLQLSMRGRCLPDYLGVSGIEVSTSGEGVKATVTHVQPQAPIGSALLLALPVELQPIPVTLISFPIIDVGRPQLRALLGYFYNW